MLIYRIDRSKYLNTALTGFGAALHGGRWNRRSVVALYGSETRALALLEILVQVKSVQLIPLDRIVLSIEVDESLIRKIDTEELGVDWNNVLRPPTANAVLFEKYCVSDKYLGIRVPSVVIPAEYNYVLYPGHEAFIKKVKLSSSEPLPLDPRLL